MFTGIGIIVLFLGLAWLMIYQFLPKETVTEETRFGKKTKQAAPEFLLWFTPKRTMKIMLAGFVLMMLEGLFFYAKPGTAYSVQYLWGGDKMVASQGLKVKWWGRLIPISYEIALQDIFDSVQTVKTEGIYYRDARRWEFNDAIKADIATTVIIGVNYQDEESFLDMADRNRSEEKLVYGRIIPVYDQALKNTCKLVSAQDYISGAAADFDRYFRDQLENGMYILEEHIEVEEKEVIGDSSVVRSINSGGQNSRSKRYVIKYVNGEPLRDERNSLKQYGLSIMQASVSGIDWEETFDQRLQLQKEQVAQTQLEKQEAEKEYYATLKAVQKGEREKAETRVEQEKIQIEETVAAETKAKAALFKEQEEVNLLSAAKKEAERIRVLAEAESYKNSRLVSAGLTPQERANIEMQTKIGVAKALAGEKGINMPTMYMSGGGDKNNSDPLAQLLMMMMAQQTMNNTAPK